MILVLTVEKQNKTNPQKNNQTKKPKKQTPRKGTAEIKVHKSMERNGE